MRRCPSCGAVTDDDSMPFCAACGAFFPPGDHTVTEFPMRETGTKKVSGLKVLVILLGLMMIGSGIMLFTKAPPEEGVDGDTSHFEYAWDGHAVRVEYDSNDYKKAVDSGIHRGGTSSATRYATASGTVYAVTDYVVVDEYVRELETKLKTIYKGPDPAKDVAGVGYANFLSSFVQKAITYEEDKVVHDQDEYWNYPLQTLVLGKGDCEDTSILLAALLHAAGYKAAVVLLPAHAMAAVSVDLPIGYPHVGNHYSFDGARYYMVETACDKGFPLFPVGEPEDDAMRKAIHHIFPMPETTVDYV